MFHEFFLEGRSSALRGGGGGGGVKLRSYLYFHQQGMPSAPDASRPTSMFTNKSFPCDFATLAQISTSGSHQSYPVCSSTSAMVVDATISVMLLVSCSCLCKVI